VLVANKEHIVNKFLLPLAALTLSGFAAAGSHVNSVVVRYGDLNLNSQAGIARLHKRLRNAAESVCSQLETTTLSLNEPYKKCVAGAVAGAVAKVGNENLSNFHAHKGRGAVVASN
jgi:UrcA family protein